MRERQAGDTLSTMSTPEIERELGGILIPRRGNRPMVRGEGCWLWDDQDRRYLDLTSAHGTAPLGHSHPALVRAISEQAERLIALSSSFFNDSRAAVLAELAKHLPQHFAHIFLCNSGTEAVEAALKFATLTTGRSGWVALKRGFHGRSLGALGVTWSTRFRKPFAELLHPTTFVTPNDLDELERAITAETSAFIAEPVQGESGVLPVQAEFLCRAQELCKHHGALFVADEIQTGFGRTGSWFAHTESGIEPDLMVLAKGIAGGFPMGAVAMSKPVAEALRPGLHGTTFGGGPLASSAAIATLQTLAEEDLPAVAGEQGNYLLGELGNAIGDYTLVRELRGRGLMVGIELRKKVAPFLSQLMEEHNLLALPAGPTVLRLLPALIVTREQIDQAVKAIAAVLE